MGWREWEENYIEWTRSMPSTFSWYVLLIVLVIFPSVSLYISSLLFHGIGMPTADGAVLLPKGAPCSGRGLAAVEARHLAVTYVGCCGAAGPWGWVRQLETRRRSSVVGRRRRRRHLYRPSRCDRRVRSSLRERIALHVHLLKD